jgi:hypothetical protein
MLHSGCTYKVLLSCWRVYILVGIGGRGPLRELGLERRSGDAGGLKVLYETPGCNDACKRLKLMTALLFTTAFTVLYCSYGIRVSAV